MNKEVLKINAENQIGQGFKTLAGCPLCGNAHARHAYNLGLMQVFHCPQCGLHYMNPCLNDDCMVASYESSQSMLGLSDSYNGYYEYGSMDKDTKTVIEIKRCLGTLESYLTSGSLKRLFEIGSGSGLFLAMANQRGWSVAGVDSSKRNVALAYEKYSITLDCGMFEKFDGEGRSYDAVAMLDVLEHRSDPHNFLGRAVGLVRKGGLVLVAVPNHASMLQYLSKLLFRVSGNRISMGLKKVYLLEHTCHYDKKTLGRLFTMNGIEPLEYFQSSTDLARYRFRPLERFMAASVLLLGKATGLQNRLIAIGRKT